MKLTPLAMAVLELLLEKPMHPYEMAQVLRTRHIEARANVKPGSLYHAVERLESHGHIEVVDTQREGRRPERTVYGVTEAGRDAFLERAKAMVGSVAPDYPEYATGLSALNELEREDALAELRARALKLQAAAAADQVIIDSLEAKPLPAVYWLDVKFMAARRAFELAWTNQLIEDITTGRVAWVPADPKDEA
ncbi:PadR family transcriptional regulator [Kutzneria kofuensis]|uniref:DNA-binding PadR family transcriptional regulator n=1 Tax=Kutzneria kofuensis TaxID=103725 RepID=A0A7W9KLS3_9PSEU|nr:PadR family transcriptional regulator [Kutzneria kofuensis]MBB5894790.1 DNA-binding PadR family transcriptional regulator [Kutzneria kofuensis]